MRRGDDLLLVGVLGLVAVEQFFAELRRLAEGGVIARLGRRRQACGLALRLERLRARRTDGLSGSATRSVLARAYAHTAALSSPSVYLGTGTFAARRGVADRSLCGITATMAEEKRASKPDRVRFNYVKSPFFHTIHCDGAMGGPTPRGFVHVAIYSERPAIPQVTEHPVENDRLGPENVAARVSREGIVRELQVDMIMDIHVATALRDFLDDKINELRTFLEEVKP